MSPPKKGETNNPRGRTPQKAPRSRELTAYLTERENAAIRKQMAKDPLCKGAQIARAMLGWHETPDGKKKKV